LAKAGMTAVTASADAGLICCEKLAS